MKRIVLALSLLAAVLCAACGTTTTPLARARVGSSDELGGEVVTSTAPDSTTEATDAALGDGTDGTATTAASRTGATASSVVAHAATKAPLKVGVLYTTGLQSLATAFGSSANSPDPKAYVEALIGWINKHGGLAGHTLSPVYAVLDTLSGTDISTQYQAACSKFTEDNHVVAVTSSAPVDSGLAGCLNTRKVPLIAAWGIATFADSDLAKSPMLFLPNAPSANRATDRLITELLAQNWASTRWNASGACVAQTAPKIGVLSVDTPVYRRMYDTIIAPRLAAAHLPVAQVFWMAQSGNVASALAQASSQASLASLKFASSCVDHVLIRTPNPIVPELFMVVAGTQNYRPRYGWDSDQAAVTAQELLPDPVKELHGALGIGWQPYNDVQLGQFDSAAKAPGARCLGILTQAGLPPSGRADGYSDLQTCDALLFLQAATAGAPEPITATAVGARAAALGGAYAPSLAYQATFAPNHRAGVNAFRRFAFNDACVCFRYTSGLQPL